MLNKQDNKGDKNIIAGGDISQVTILADHKNLHSHLNQFFDELDEKINDLFPRGLISPSENDEHRRFSSKTLSTSLVSCGIPLNISVELLKDFYSKTKNYLDKYKNDNIEYTTDIIRQIITNSIYSLSTNEHSIKEIEKWGIIYSRQFGNPNIATKVIYKDFTEDIVDFKFIKNKLIPHIISKCYNVDYEKKKHLFYSSVSFDEMAREILNKIRLLNVYALDYKTLFGLSYNLAAQPPNPWINHHLITKNNVKYNLDKAYGHYKVLKNKDLSNLIKLKKSIIECIDHSCSAILLHYHLFIGSGNFRPLHNLIKYLELSNNENGNNNLWDKCSIKNLSGDLNSINSSLNSFFDLLKKIRNLSGSFYQDGKIEHIISNTKILFKISNNLLHEINDFDKFNISINSTSSKEYFESILEITKKIPILINNKSNTSKYEITVLNKEFSSNIQNSTNIIKIIPVQLEIKEKSEFSALLDTYEEKHAICNSYIFIFQKPINKVITDLTKEIWGNYYIYPMLANEFLKIINSNDRNKEFYEKLLHIQNKLI